MAQLPPKIPAITQNLPSFPHQTMSNYFSTTTPNAAPAMENHQSSWVDEFLDFTSSRRGTHRRSISDSIAFIETTNDIPSLVEESCHETAAHNNEDDDIDDDDDDGNNSSPSAALISGNLGFDKLDDEQLMSMFSDDHLTLSLPPSTTSNPSTPSDQNSNNAEKPLTQLDQQFQPQFPRQCQQEEEQQQQQQEKEQQQFPKTEPGEVESSSCKQEPPPPASPNVETIVDPKRVKRILANRQSAQRSRVRKLQYISELERSVTTLQTEVSALSPRVAYLDHQRLILNVDNGALKQRIAALAQDKIFKDAHQEALKKEIERLRQVYHQQNLNKMNNHSNLPSPRPQQQQTPTHESVHCTDN